MVIAALDNSAAAQPVLAVAAGVAELLKAGLEAVHVRENGDVTARAAARAAGVAFRELRGPVAASLAEVARTERIAAMVIGARGAPPGRRPAGHLALRMITTLEMPIVVVPPHPRAGWRPRRVLVPLDASRTTSTALAGAIELARDSGLKIVVLHVLGPDSIPPFVNQVAHEHEAWEREFLARYCPACRPEEVDIEVRVGSPEQHLLAVAARSDVDLIALGWAQDLSPERAAVVREALGASQVPLLLIPLAAKPGLSRETRSRATIAGDRRQTLSAHQSAGRHA
jgi:nucleotide-binding universal stress UspA family protein